MSDSQQTGPLSPTAFLVLLVLFLGLPLLCCGGCALVISLLNQHPPAAPVRAPVQAPAEDSRPPLDGR